MKLFLVAVIMAAVLYAAGGVGKTQALWTEYQHAEAKAEQDWILQRRDEIFASSYLSPVGCMAPKSALKQLECKNKEDLARNDFNARFNAKLAQGWRPAKQ